MKENTYRGFNKKSKLMYGVYGFETMNRWVFRCNIANEHFRDLETVHSVKDDLDDYIIMESTGFQDRTGKDIYRGDVVMMRFNAYDEVEFFVINRARSGEWRVENNKGKPLAFVDNECVVVGNVYQNPELDKILRETYYYDKEY